MKTETIKDNEFIEMSLEDRNIRVTIKYPKQSGLKVRCEVLEGLRRLLIK